MEYKEQSSPSWGSFGGQKGAAGSTEGQGAQASPIGTPRSGGFASGQGKGTTEEVCHSPSSVQCEWSIAVHITPESKEHPQNT
mmetsp:Transcript_21280/g.46456  ORF Transcript_21280/g.46456 Transcript_21280/m.46456 type:complete len:83 (-) Transcript_21280:433-681(-)|eukprot:CAMPEP_0168295444 /NCGR_PEP_ID=MMETSP0142_2-20121227/12002_1 /TAXON_ID=44445 /ORGANISM="Pseudo-nitzschia australis, Strain 10249 10 AB" /LENGTH=82 /DNA_ID=CAMNT_0008244123 /DNA_START=254 /DNA_END=502 /DNA_ORIENTATION=-